MRDLRDKLNHRRMIDGIALGVCALLTAAVYFVGVTPVLEQRQVRAAERTRLASEQARARSLADTVQRLRDQLQQTRQAVANKSLRLQPPSTLNQRLSQITALAAQCNLHIERIRPGQPEPGEHYYTVPIQLTGKGAFRASTAFLHRLHAARPDIAVAALSLSGRPDRGDADTSPAFDFKLLWHASPPAETNY